MNEHDALRVSVCLAAGWRRVVVGTVEDERSYVWRGPDGETAETDADLPPLTLDWLHALVAAITDDERQTFEDHLEQICDTDFWDYRSKLRDPIHANAEQRARAYVATTDTK